MNSYQIGSSSTNVIASGTFITFNNEPTEIVYGPENEKLKLIIEFKDDPSTNKVNVQNELIDNTTLKITYINFNSPIGTGSIRPIEVGRISNHKLFIHVRVYAPDKDSDKVVHFTFYTSKEKTNA